MRYVRHLTIAIFLLAASLCFAGDKSGGAALEPWLPVTQQDWQVNSVPGDPGAGAIQLYYSYYRDDNDEFITVYRRIKVLREAGMKWADMNIILGPGVSIKELYARTIHPDGTIVEFQGKPYDKTIFKARGIKLRAAAITLPQVTVGSVIEYRCRLGWFSHWFFDSEWPIQSDLYTLKARFRFRALQRFVYNWTDFNPTTNIRHSRVAYSYLNQVDATVPEKKDGNLMELQLENIPAFEAEEYMPPEDDYKPLVSFYYGGEEIASPDKFWDFVGREWPKVTETFIGDYKEVRNAASQAIGGETDAEKKLRKLYARAQQIRNLSYERERTETELKKEELKSNRYMTDVLSHGYGDQSDISRLFVAMARAAGFEAYVLQVADRAQMSFQRNLLSLNQLHATAAIVNVNGHDTLLFPGTKYCPYGLIPWNHSAVTALKLSKSGSEFFTTPAPQVSLIHRTAKVALATDGSLKGDVTIEYSGEDALQHRLDAVDTDEAGRRKSLEDQVKAWVSDQAIVKLQDAKGWEGTEEPLVAHFTIEVPNYASVAGKRLVTPAFFFPTLQKDMFVHTVRRYPIMFSYPFSEADEVTIKLPDGYSVEAPPYRRKASLSFAKYEIANKIDNNELTVTRSLRFEGLRFDADDYVQIKGFFNIVQAGDAGTAVLQQGSGEKASN
jgi:uncharacterized protein DUF3857/transglutaminase superfamily protein